MRGISEDEIKSFYKDKEVCRISLLLQQCKELQEPWMTLDAFLKSGFEGKCLVFSENIVLETEYDTNGFWYVFKYIDQNTIDRVIPIHKPEPPK